MKKFLRVFTIVAILLMMLSVVFAENSTFTRPITGSRVTRPSSTASTTKTISEIKITIKEPKYGEKFDWAPIMVTEGITFDHMYWNGWNLTTAGGYVGCNENDTAINTKYRATIYFKVNEGYQLASDLKTGTVNSTSNLELLSLNFSPHGINTPEFVVEKPDASTKEIEGFKVDVAEIKVGSALPNSCVYKAGDEPEETITIPTKNSKLMVYWIQEDSVAKAGTEYVLHFERNLEQAKVSDDYRVMVNNVEIPEYRIEKGILEFNYKVKTPGEAITTTTPETKPATTSGETETKPVATSEETKPVTITSGDTKPVATPSGETKPTTTTSEDTKQDVTNISWSKASDWAIDELNKANELGVIPEIFNKEDLTKNITRKEFAHVAVKLYEKVSGQKAVAVANNPFTDTKDEEILKAYNVGITNGTSETTFEPDALITREQMATMMTRALAKAGKDTSVDMSKVTKFADDDKMHDWGKSSIYYMSSIEIIKGVGENTFDVLGNATREQALLISERSALKFAK